MLMSAVSLTRPRASLVELPACTIVYLSLTFSMTVPMTFLARSGAVLTETRLTVWLDILRDE